MADNVTFQSTTLATVPDGTKVATDLIGLVQYQRVKVTFGIDGVATDVSATDPLPVTGTLTAVTEATATAAAPAYVEGTANPLSQNLTGDVRVIAKQSGTWNIATVTTVTAVTTITNPVAVTGTFWQATQPISAVSLPLPTGAMQQTGGTVGIVAGSAVIGHVITDTGSTTAVTGTVATSSQKSATGTQTSVTSSGSDGTILAANANRLGGTIFNDSTQILYLLLANATSSATNYTVQVPPATYYGYFELPFGYTGIVKGIWASANGNARVMEFTA